MLGAGISLPRRADLASNAPVIPSGACINAQYSTSTILKMDLAALGPDFVDPGTDARRKALHVRKMFALFILVVCRGLPISFAPLFAADKCGLAREC